MIKMARVTLFFSLTLFLLLTLTMAFVFRLGQALPSGAELTYSSINSWYAGNVQIYALDVGRGLSGRLLSGYTNHLPGLPVIWSPDGEQMAFVLDTLERQTCLAHRAGGDCQPLGQGVIEKAYSPAWSPDNSQLAFIGGNSEQADVYLAASDGHNPLKLTHTGRGYKNLVWSPDSRFLVAESRQSPEDLLLIDVMQNTSTNITEHPDRDVRPTWSPDSRWLAFFSSRDNSGTGGMRFDLYVLDLACADVAGGCVPNLRRLTNNHPADASWVIQWSPDSQRILLGSLSWTTGSDILLIDLTGNVTLMTPGNMRSSSPVWSPDGAWLAYEANHGGSWNVFVARGNGSAQRQLTSGAYDSRRPQWTPDGDGLLYIANPSRNWDIYLTSISGEKQPVRLTDDWGIDYTPIWRPSAAATHQRLNDFYQRLNDFNWVEET